MTRTLDEDAAERLVQRYLERHGRTELEGVLALFAEDASLEDPVGAAVRVGSEAIRAFYRETHARNGPLVFERVGRTLVGGDEVAVHVRARLARDPAGAGMDVIYTLRVDREGKIRGLRAFF